ncbi:MAG: VCBS repeat-containing protein [Verrucomicrobiales bacterium]|nr:VCBS repeat-containing protein [Verrucomicrobiales bacterium]
MKRLYQHDPVFSRGGFTKMILVLSPIPFRFPIRFCLFYLVFFAVVPFAPLAAAEIEMIPLVARSGATPDAPLFTRLTPEESGIAFVVPVDITHPMRRAYYSSMACGGVAIGDVDLDGRSDIFATSGVGDNGLFLQTGPLKFENVTESLGLKGDDRWGVHVVLVDIENDGDLDIYICNFDSPNQLYINLLFDHGVRSATLKFEERAAAYGLDRADGSVVAAFADYDCDGLLDMYLLTHQIYRASGRPAETIKLLEENGKIMVEEKWRRWYQVEEGKRGENGEYLYTEAPRADILYRNQGDGTFVETSAEAGITAEPNWGNSATWWDYNNDGWPDLYVGNDFKSPDLLYRNNGDGTFTEVSQGLLRHTTWNSMGAAQADFTNRGLFDFILADMLPRNHYMQKASFGSMAQRKRELSNVKGVNQIMRNTLHINTGTDHFAEGAWMAGLAHTDWTWAIRAADFDCDGWTDLFFANGVPGQFNHSDLPPLNHQDLVGKNHFDHFMNTPRRREQNFAFRNRGEYQFEDVSKAWGLDHVGMSYGASFGDLDGDGFLDLLVSNLDDPLSVYHNTGTTGNRAVVELHGTSSNRRGLGALVTAETPDGVTRSRQFFPIGGYLDADEPIVHLGLGGNEKISKLRVVWPGGLEQEFSDLPVNQRFAITEPADTGKKRTPIKSMAPESPRYRRSDALDSFPHEEDNYDDFARQPLLTFKLSQLGPGQAWGDIDGDGVDDLFLGGAAGQGGRLFLNRTPEKSSKIILTPLLCDALERDAACEDMGALFFDANDDGHLDLYVASGGVECDPGEDVLRDRLYLNDGKGDFTAAPEGSLPDLRESSGVVAAADMDRDGSLEIFIGSRSIPGDYPTAPKSILLKREGDHYVSAAKDCAPELENGGLVTGAVWTDVNNDTWPDLLVTNDWGPVRLYLNEKGKLVKATKAAGLKGDGLEMLGWWTGIDAGDVNGDGLMDFVASNLGLNTQYQPSLLFPELLFYSDFDHSGISNIVEAHFVMEGGDKKIYPRATFHDASFAMPSIADRLQTYHNYASAELTGIYPFKAIQSALLLQANCAESSLFLNDGEGGFVRTPLPRTAQLSPGFGIVLRDVNLDGRLDCYLVQNHFSATEELGEMASGLSILLLNTGDPENPFRVEEGRESGLEIPGDAKSLGACDVNRDGLTDYLIGVNNAVPELYLHTGRRNAKGNEPLRVRLLGPKGNRQALGARVEVNAEGMPRQDREVNGGGSYLTQSDRTLLFARPTGLAVELLIRWPDGTEEKRSVEASEKSVTLSED